MRTLVLQNWWVMRFWKLLMPVTYPKARSLFMAQVDQLSQTCEAP